MTATRAPAPGCASASDSQITLLAETVVNAARALRASTGFRHAGDHDIDAAFVPLLCVLDAGPTRVGELADCLQGDLSTISRQVSHLVEAGLASKDVSENDRRVVQVSLTRRGRATLATIRADRATWIRRVTQDWSSEDVATLQVLLDRLATSAQAADRADLRPGSARPARQTT